jgi:hypothetical protein
MAVGKINQISVYTAEGVETYSLGQPVPELNKNDGVVMRNIGFIEKEGNSNSYQLLDKSRNMMARFENGTYATWFDDVEKGE